MLVYGLGVVFTQSLADLGNSFEIVKSMKLDYPALLDFSLMGDRRAIVENKDHFAHEAAPSRNPT